MWHLLLQTAITWQHVEWWQPPYWYVSQPCLWFWSWPWNYYTFPFAMYQIYRSI